MSAEPPRASRGVSNDAGAGCVAVLHEAAVQHMRAGRPLDAQLCCRRILELDAGHVDTLQLMGLLSLQARQYDLAIEWVARADQQAPAMGYLASLSTALEQQGLSQEAFKAFERTVQLRPEDAEAWAAHGNALANLGRTEEALFS